MLNSGLNTNDYLRAGRNYLRAGLWNVIEGPMMYHVIGNVMCHLIRSHGVVTCDS